MTFHPSSTPKMGMYLDSLGNSSWSSTSNVPFSYLMACRVIVTVGSSVAEQLPRVRRRRRRLTRRPVATQHQRQWFGADLAVSGGPVRAIVVVVVAGHATSHTLNTYMNTQQLPPSTLQQRLLMAVDCLLWNDTVNYWIANYCSDEYDHWLPCDDSVAFAGVCGGQLRCLQIFRWWVDEIFLTIRPRRRARRHCRGVSVGWPARCTGRVRCTFVCRLFRHLSTTANDGGGGVYNTVCTHTQRWAAHEWCSAFAVRRRPVITRPLG